jgi:ketosteroid isomerase-like protein
MWKLWTTVPDRREQPARGPFHLPSPPYQARRIATTAFAAVVLVWNVVVSLAAQGAASTAHAKAATSPRADAGVESLIEAERAFSRFAGERGIQAAFLEFLADDGILFRPGPVNGKTWLREHPPDPGRLWWEPAHVELASAGDLGLSTGPWSYTRAGGDQPVAFGQFASVWRRSPCGRWEVVLDHGISHPQGSASGASASAQVEGRISTPVRDAATGDVGNSESLLAADRSFDAVLSAAGAAIAYGSAAVHPAIRLLRSGKEPVVGREAAARAVLTDEHLTWDTATAHVSRSRDLGYTHGSARPASGPGEATRYYARVWRRAGDGPWRIVLDVAPDAP